MKLSIATMACLPRRTLQIAIDHGCLSKAEITAINALRASGGRSSEIIAKRRLEQAITKQFAERDRDAWVENTIGKYAYARAVEVLKEMRPMTTSVDLLEERVGKAADVQRMLRDTIRKYQDAHPGCNRADAIDAVLFGPHTREMVRLGSQIDDVVKAKNTLPQPGATTNIDFSNPLRGTAGYDAGVDGRRPGRAHASGGPQSGEEDQPVIEDANDVLERLTKEHMRAGKSRPKAMSDAAMSQEFSDAHRRERARKYGI
jgi:hypothetical protein